MNDIKVSFVVPIYKKSIEQLEKCVKSLLEQSLKEIEVICVFDGNNSILEGYVDSMVPVDGSKVRKIVIEHGGAPKARNAGLKEAKGQYISFWDCDCYAEPEMAKVWIMAFDSHPDVDFVYSGYKWTDPQALPFKSEKFDSWTIQKYNYIASMFPVKRDKAVEWDESLEGLQDWDYWRRIVKNGSQGYFIRGYGFATDLPDSTSISGNTDKTKERVLKIREKHGDSNTDTYVFGTIHSAEAIRISKIFDFDYFPNYDFYGVKEYKNILFVGFNYEEMGNLVRIIRDNPKAKKIIYWLGNDSEAILYGPYRDTGVFIKSLKENVSLHLCPDNKIKSDLKEIGIESELINLPMEQGIPMHELPTDFRVLAFTDDNYHPLIEQIKKAIPMINIDYVDVGQTIDISKYSCVLEFIANKQIRYGTMNMLINGRYVISNIQEPYCGYVDITLDTVKFIDEIIDKIMEVKDKKVINKVAQDYYLQLNDPAKFEENLISYLGEKK